MALRWCILLGLLAVAHSQQLNFTDADDLRASIEERYASDDANMRRREHLYCLGYFDNSTDTYAVGENFTSYPDDSEVWTIYMQFPALSYLDVNRKGALFRLILQIAGVDSATSLNVVRDNLCQGALEFYEVTEYAESVLARLYFGQRDGVAAPTGLTPSGLNTTFHDNYMSSSLTVPFLGRRAINLLGDETFNMVYGRGLPPGSNLHPGSTLPNDRDPTFLAIVLGSWGRNVTLEEAEEGTPAVTPRNIQNRAGNPNPINYDLEAGDIVFSVIGSILLTGVMALVILGFCIHPFLLA